MVWNISLDRFPFVSVLCLMVWPPGWSLHGFVVSWCQEFAARELAAAGGSLPDTGGVEL